MENNSAHPSVGRVMLESELERLGGAITSGLPGEFSFLPVNSKPKINFIKSDEFRRVIDRHGGLDRLEEDLTPGSLFFNSLPATASQKCWLGIANIRIRRSQEENVLKLILHLKDIRCPQGWALEQEAWLLRLGLGMVDQATERRVSPAKPIYQTTLGFVEGAAYEDRGRVKEALYRVQPRTARPFFSRVGII